MMLYRNLFLCLHNPHRVLQRRLAGLQNPATRLLGECSKTLILSLWPTAPVWLNSEHLSAISLWPQTLFASSRSPGFCFSHLCHVRRTSHVPPVPFPLPLSVPPPSLPLSFLIFFLFPISPFHTLLDTPPRLEAYF